MKTITAVIALLGALAAPAAADRGHAKPAAARLVAQAAVADPFKSLARGTGFDLSRRDRAAALPTEAKQEIKLLPLTDAQVSQTVKVRGEDVNFCWDRLPKSMRVASTAVLHLQIEADGKVTSVTVDGDAPDEATSCIRDAAASWVFPRADVPSTVEHAIRLR
jgi:hypothetical protein